MKLQILNVFYQLSGVTVYYDSSSRRTWMVLVNLFVYFFLIFRSLSIQTFIFIQLFHLFTGFFSEIKFVIYM